MHVFVIGGTGVLGRALIPKLVRAGRKVTALGRTLEKLIMIETLGAVSIQGDIFDGQGLSHVFRTTRPDAVINFATSIPRRLRIDMRDWALNDQIRTEGTRNVVRACEESGTKLLVQESVGYVCSPRGDEPIAEDAPRSTHPFLKATVEMEDIVRASKAPSVLLRFAALMSPDAWHTQQSVAALGRGMLPIIGRGDAYVSMIHAEDAATATVNVLARPEIAAGNTYHVTDNEPATMAEVFNYAARVLRTAKPRNVPPFVAKIAVGSLTLEILGASYRMDSAKIRNQLNFAPLFPSYRETWTDIAKALAGRPLALSDDLSN